MGKAYPIACAAGLAFIVAVLARVPHVNGPWYWQWPWRDISLFRGALFLALPLLPYLFVTGRLFSGVGFSDVRPPLAILALCLTLMCLMGILADPTDSPLLLDIVRSPGATSYYTDALSIGNPIRWLAGYHQEDLELHSSTHPPGPILYYRLWISALGPDAGALGGALGIALLAGLGVPVMYRFAGLWTSHSRERLTACTLYTMLPGTSLFYPCFDIVYPILSMLLFTFWVEAVEGDERKGAAFGAVLFASTFMAYNLLASGSLILLHSIFHLARKDAGSGGRWKWLRVCGRAAATYLLLQCLLWLATGYLPAHAFLRALQNQQQHAAATQRPYVACLAFDLYDFLLGGGILPGMLFLCHLFRPGAHRLAVVGGLAILMVDFTGLLRCETARVWAFLQPWIVVPAAMELSGLLGQRREAILWFQWLVVLVVKCNLGFVYP